MAIGQDVRAFAQRRTAGDFAKLQNQDSAGFIAAEEAEKGMAGFGMSEQDMGKGFAQMSQVYEDTRREFYMGAGGREHD